MRLWSLHPKYLDSKGLVALWREALLAQNVLRGNTKGYKNHPQLIRFKETVDPIQFIGAYLLHVQQEATHRGYNFDASKIHLVEEPPSLIPVTDGQLLFELRHLRGKLQQRDPAKFLSIQHVSMPELHPGFAMVAGSIAAWER